MNFIFLISYSKRKISFILNILNGTVKTTFYRISFGILF
ncbi:hypothetical protein RIEPE_0109 [Candidatus Riesia pediculicola USDA]|uniref:Uncharacterized protein n=1 Tax=Riesia pediculicola (strain USDA) TaxID=515618 RepID=D4G7S0_RIEPU|nr:hypothetical protein RIEPE_0109 [Candidatus Riesia pediculicola USDA]